MNRPLHPLRAEWVAQALDWLESWVARWQTDASIMGVMLTGSYAEGYGGPGSDLDLLLVAQGPPTLEGWYVPGDPYTLDITRISPATLHKVAAHPTPGQVTLFGQGRVQFDRDGKLNHAQAALAALYAGERQLHHGEGMQICLSVSRSLNSALPLERRGTILAPLQLMRTLWLALEAYPATRNRWPESIPSTLRWIERNDPPLYGLVAAATLQPMLEELAVLVTQVVNYVLAPLGGRVQTGEALVLAHEQSDASAGLEQWQTLTKTLSHENEAHA